MTNVLRQRGLDGRHARPGVSRRDFIAICADYGLRTALFATTVAAGLGGPPAIERFGARDARAREGAKYNFRFGASVMNPQSNLHQHTGCYEFTALVEELTDGEVHIQLIDNGGACAETSCGERVATGVIEIGSSSAQNVSAVFPYAIAPDWPFLWRDREAFLNLMFSPDSEPLYRDVFRRTYGIEMLWTSCEMRVVFMGLKYADRPDVRTPEDLKGVKIRLTNSEMILAFTQSMGMSPIPLAFSELLEGLKSGLVDAAETWPSANTGFGMASVTSQDLAIDFSPGDEMTFMSLRAFDRLPDRLKEAVYEAAWRAQLMSYEKIREAQNTHIGNGDDPSPDSVYVTKGIRRIVPTAEEMAAFRALGMVDNNPSPYDFLRTRLDGIAGFDVYEAVKSFAAQEASQRAERGEALNPQKWWT